jgi:hypothetical protein
MIDYISCSIPFTDIRQLRNNLDFRSEYDVKTGELKTTINGFVRECAFWNGLKFEIYCHLETYNIGKIKFSGSLHKFSNGVNYDDFDAFQLRKTIEDISSLIGVTPNEIHIHSIEFGVNIETELNPSEVLNRLIYFKQKDFESQRVFKNSKNGFIQRCTRHNYQLKIYNKSIQYNLFNNILRYEIKVTKMQFFKTKINNMSYLSDLFQVNVRDNLLEILLDFWDHILLKEHIIKLNYNLSAKDIEILKNSRFENYWKIKKDEYKPYKFNRLMKQYYLAVKKSNTTSFHEIIRNQIQSKWQKLSHFVNYLPISAIVAVNKLPLCMM